MRHTLFLPLNKRVVSRVTFVTLLHGLDEVAWEDSSETLRDRPSVRHCQLKKESLDWRY